LVSSFTPSFKIEKGKPWGMMGVCSYLGKIIALYLPIPSKMALQRPVVLEACPCGSFGVRSAIVFLQRMRRGVGSWFVKGMLFLIALVFALWGVGGFQGRKRQVVAWVDETPITTLEYRFTLQRMLQRYEQLYPQGVPTQLKRFIRRQALESLIQRRLLEQEARAVGLWVSRRELAQDIASDPLFQRRGSFDRQFYLWTVSRLGMRPQEFERQRAEDLLVGKVLELINDAPLPTSKELRFYQKLVGRQVSLKFVRLRPEDFLKQVTCTDKELRDYYRQHRQEFRRELALRVRYLRLDPQRYRSQVQVQSQEVEERYELDLDRFRVPERRRLRRILVKEQKKAKEIMTKLRSGADFAQLARQQSRGLEAKRGGDLGFVSEQELQAPLRQAFRASVGELIGPIETPQGFAILRVEEVKPARVRSLKEVRSQLVEEIRQEKATRRARSEAKRAYLALRRGQSLQAWAKEHRVPLRTEGPCTREEARGAFRAAFDRLGALRPGGALRPLSWGGSFWVFQLVERQEPRQLTFQEAKEEVARRVRLERARQLALREARAALKEGGSLEEVAKRRGWRVEHTGSFGWTGRWVPRIGEAPLLKEAAFRLTSKRPCLKEPLEVDGQVILACLEAGTIQPSKDVERGLEKRIRQAMRMAWMEHLRRRAKVRLSEELR